MIDPCRFCYLYPHDCPTMCRDKMKYTNEVEEDVQIIRKVDKPDLSHFWYEHGRKYEMGKNGIRRELNEHR